MFCVSPIFAITLLSWIIIFTAFASLFVRKMTNLADEYAASQSLIGGEIVDSVGNFANVKIFGRKDYERSYLHKAYNDMKIRYDSREWFYFKLKFPQGLSIAVLLGCMLSILVWLRMNGKVTIGDFLMINWLTMLVSDSTWYLCEKSSAFLEAVGECKQSLRALFIPIEITDKPDAKELVVTKGEITFDKVHFQYKDNASIFEDKSIIITPGQKIGLVGYSGSGKSTFVNLILRLYDIQSGAILIDGQDIRDVTQESLHQNIGMIPQDPSLFHRTLMNNIRYGQVDATDEEVIEAAKKAHAHDFIMNTPEKYQSLVGERGIKLSGGQRQRIAIARAILKNAPILILDEATSALDSVTEGQIQDSLNELMSGKTVIVIAHRLSTLLHMDRILVFDNGKIVEDGSHVKLIEQNGMYKELWDAQVSGFLPDAKN